MNREEMMIEPAELMGLLGDPGLRIYDATMMFYMGMSAEEARKMPTAHALYLAGHIPGAAFFDHQLFSDPLSEYEYMLLPERLLTPQIGALGIGNDHHVILYASSLLPSAARAWWVLRYAGLQNVRILNGGLAAWKAAGGAVDSGEERYEAVEFTPAFRPEMIADLAEVKAAVEEGGAYIENALVQEWYDREHIPGSVLLAMTDIMTGWDTLRPQKELEALVPARAEGERVITYCGGGIAAAMNAMVHLMVGHENVAVYDGSLFEWMGEGMPVSSKSLVNPSAS